MTVFIYSIGAACTSFSFDAASMPWPYSDRLRKVLPLRADVHIGDHHSDPLGRVSTQAWVFNPTPRPDIIPRLHDAKVNGMAQLGLNINGVEEIDGVRYAQSWWCRSE